MTNTQGSEVWLAWLDGHWPDAVEYRVPFDGDYDVAFGAAVALGVDPSSHMFGSVNCAPKTYMYRLTSESTQ